MNITSPSIRHLGLLRCRRSPLSGAFFILCVLFAATAGNVKADYAFTLIADSMGAFKDFGTVPSPSLNAAGTVAFVANLDNGSFGIFKGNGGIITAIATNPLPLGGFSNPAINQAGTVAFSEIQGNGVIKRVVSGNGGPLTTIADTAGQFRDFYFGYSTSINSAGAVTFLAALDTGPNGFFVGNGGAVTPVLINSSVDFNFSINGAGTFAFRSGNGARVVTANGGLITTIADNSGPLNYFGTAPSLNGTGTVAFSAGVGGPDGGVSGIYSGNGGPLTTIADISGPFRSFSFNDFTSNPPSINGSGTVAFLASLDVGGFGIYTGDGNGTSEIIGSGDTLFGSTITGLSISPTSLNDSGQVAFYYELANGTTGIAIANPVPEPSSSLLLALSLGLRLARRTTRKA